MWCLGFNGVTRKIHPTAQVEVSAGTVGQFTNNYLTENGRLIIFIGQLSINGSVQLLGIPDFSKNSVLFFIEKSASSQCALWLGGTPIPQIITRELAWGELTAICSRLG